ncbi:ATP-dependent DNA helicase (RecD/TraA family) [Anaerobacterium chartisolvens]|uniref:ATP-dependent RecD2 DNA helicase n=1 Tax=Anaerobacterium chartisolvens TaxID=1297424 RepID=A0A369BHY2_9FIRM|nr:ATP-dependent RecD-like DNA helicase [Anaerobacterium chartisolvens]RCX21021.1 ATP-dependent DNA helicase (RecD/TraA family) [Anaerobacterium chartisolvens]
MVTIEATVEEIIFSNETNGYTVCDVKSEKDTVTAVGYMPFINVGEILRLTGKWVTHPDYGEQLKVETYEKVLPDTIDAIEKYLSSGVIKGVGPQTAKKIIEKYGEAALEVIRDTPEILTEIKGISRDKALKIGQAFEEQKGLREVVMFFQKYGISPVYSAKIYKAFGERTIEEIKANPYKLADEVFGIGFKTADRIARSMGIDPVSRYRVCSGIKYVLSRAALNGHTYMPEFELNEYTSQLLEVRLEDINAALIASVLERAVWTERSGEDKDGENGYNKVYLNAFYNAELGVCRRLLELSEAAFRAELGDFEQKIGQVQREEGVVLADMQKAAVREALTNGVLIITGGPGTGKTTIIKTIIRLLNSEGYEVVLAAPTGRAAKRMSDATGFEAKTIHRLLEIGYSGTDADASFQKDEANPIAADVVIIDEMSMVDILLMNNLLKAVSPGTRLILVGDVDQLPSVGPGNVLKDIIESKMIMSVKLTEIFRQAEESMITVNAHKINKGEYPCLNKKDKDFFFLHRSNGNDLLATIVDLCSRRLPSTYGYDPMRHIQVLTPTRKGLVGVARLNIELQKALNPQGPHKNEKVFRDFIFREGDRVMQIKNNYNLRWEKEGDVPAEGMGVFNGDTGIIHKICNEEQKLIVLFEDEKNVVYDFGILDELEPAFSITIHKSQGSEFPVVVMPMFQGPKMLMTRNLLYTAVTRAKKLVVLVGSEEVLGEMIANEKETLRYSGLCEKMRKYGSGVLF